MHYNPIDIYEIKVTVVGMLDQFSRTQLQLGGTAMERLAHSSVAVFGIGGVGGYCAEALARTGIGRIGLYDDDKICLTNLNRQIIATHSTLGRYKVDVMADRIRDICPSTEVGAYRIFYEPDTAGRIDLSRYDYVVDAVDTVTAKLELVVRAGQAGTRIISSMGAGNKLDASAFEVADIYRTSSCPLARVMRRELRKRGVDSLKVVYSTEVPLTPPEDLGGSRETGRVCPQRRQIPSSNAFVPAVAGMILAGEVILDLSESRRNKELER